MLPNPSSDLYQYPENMSPPVRRKVRRIRFPNRKLKTRSRKGVLSKGLCQSLLRRRRSPARRRIRKIRRPNNRGLGSKILVQSIDLFRVTLKKSSERRRIWPSNPGFKPRPSSNLRKKWPSTLSFSSGNPTRCVFRVLLIDQMSVKMC